MLGNSHVRFGVGAGVKSPGPHRGELSDQVRAFGVEDRRHENRSKVHPVPITGARRSANRAGAFIMPLCTATR